LFEANTHPGEHWPYSQGDREDIKEGAYHIVANEKTVRSKI
jgi:hypothetical protein